MIDPDTGRFALCGMCYGAMARDLEWVEYRPHVTWIRRCGETYCLLCGDAKAMVTLEHDIPALAANQWWGEKYDFKADRNSR